MMALRKQNNNMEMNNDILEAVNRTKDFVRNQVAEYAEQNAEVYVSSKLGLTDEPEKQGVKNTYIEEFTNLMFKQIC